MLKKFVKAGGRMQIINKNKDRFCIINKSDKAINPKNLE